MLYDILQLCEQERPSFPSILKRNQRISRQLKKYICSAAKRKRKSAKRKFESTVRQVKQDSVDMSAIPQLKQQIFYGARHGLFSASLEPEKSVNNYQPQSLRVALKSKELKLDSLELQAPTSIRTRVFRRRPAGPRLREQGGEEFADRLMLGARRERPKLQSLFQRDFEAG